jgi:hypothetical protein
MDPTQMLDQAGAARGDHAQQRLARQGAAPSPSVEGIASYSRMRTSVLSRWSAQEGQKPRRMEACVRGWESEALTGSVTSRMVAGKSPCRPGN